MEQDVKVGDVGDVKLSESISGESVVGSVAVAVGPFKAKVSLDLEIDNKALLDMVVAKLPGGALHTLAAQLEAVLMPAAAVAAPSA